MNEIHCTKLIMTIQTSQPEVLNTPLATLGECPRWDEQTQSLYWVDIDGQMLWHHDIATGTNQSRSIGQAIGCFALRKQGGFVLGLRSGYAILEHWDAPIKLLKSPSFDTSIVRFNDGRCDALGRLWAGTMYEPRTQAGATLYRLDGDKTYSAHGQPVTISNGIAISPDQQFFYFADTPEHVVYRYPFHAATGRLGTREVFARWPHGGGRPDGATVDEQGNYWVALFNGSAVQCLNPQGQVIHQIDMPTKNITCVTFGGSDLSTLFITTARIRLTEEELVAQPQAGGVFTVKTNTRGHIEPRFAG
jgi:sugar lactone lactonase YvrE